MIGSRAVLIESKRCIQASGQGLPGYAGQREEPLIGASVLIPRAIVLGSAGSRWNAARAVAV